MYIQHRNVPTVGFESKGTFHMFWVDETEVNSFLSGVREGPVISYTIGGQSFIMNFEQLPDVIQRPDEMITLSHDRMPCGLCREYKRYGVVDVYKRMSPDIHPETWSDLSELFRTYEPRPVCVDCITNISKTLHNELLLYPSKSVSVLI